MGGGASAGGGQVTRALRLPLLLVLALVAVEFGSILDASPLRAYLYTPLYNATQLTLRNAERTPASLKRISLSDHLTMNYAEGSADTPAMILTVSNSVMRRPIDLNMTRTKSVENDTTPTSLLFTNLLDGMKKGSEDVNKSDSVPVTLPMCESMSDLGVYAHAPAPHAVMGGGQVTRALRLPLLLVLALVAVEFGSILDASPLRAYMYTPLYNATQPTLRNAERTPASLKRISLSDHLTMNYAEGSADTPAMILTVSNSVMRRPIDLNMTRTKSVENDTTPTSLLFTNLLDGMKKGSEDVNKSDSVPVTLPMCESMSDLGPVPANTTDLELDDVKKKFPEVQWGGRYTPPNCTAKHKVAIIVPYRDRQRHLPIFLNHMHPFLMKQQIEYGIYIVEQKGTTQFNRAKLMNVGFMESQTLQPGGFQCFIFHDIDLLPLDTRNLYSCTRQPRHMSASIDRFKFKLPYSAIFGGVSAMTLEQIHTVNGFSNKYWGWGGEDDDMYYRLLEKNYHIARYKMSIARYTSLEHKWSTANPGRYQLLSEKGKTFGRDGLSTLRYEIVQVMQYHLYSHILANIDERSWCTRKIMSKIIFFFFIMILINMFNLKLYFRYSIMIILLLFLYLLNILIII